MSEITNGDIFNVLLTIRGEIGELKSQGESNAKLLEKHDDHLSLLEANVNRQKGAAKVVVTLGTVLGAVGGVVVTWLTGKH